MSDFTDAQQKVLDGATEHYASVGVKLLDAQASTESSYGTMPEGAMEVRYAYDRADGDQTPGLEVTWYDRDGEVITSQDFG